MKKLMRSNNIKYLQIIFKNTKVFDNKFILSLLLHYKNKIPLSTVELNDKIEDCKISKVEDENILLFKFSNKYLIDACSDEREDVVKFLVDHDADLNQEEVHSSDTPLLCACRNGNKNIVNYLIKHGADINKGKEIEMFSLFNPYEYGDKSRMKYVMVDGVTPLVMACAKGHDSIVKCLIENGVDINKASKKGNTALSHSCQFGHETIVKYLVENGADVNRGNVDGMTPLMVACDYGHYSIVEYLVDHGADINNRMKDGNTALLIACLSEKENGYIIEYLVKKGANITITNNKGENAYQVASDNYKKSVLKLLEE